MEQKRLTLGEHCKAKGLKFGTPEYKREYAAEKWRRRPEESRRAHNERAHAQRRKRIKSDPAFAAKERERNRLSKQRQRLKRKEEINEQQRRNYHKAGQERKDRIQCNRRRRNPFIGIASLVKAVRAGRVEPRVLIDSTRVAIEQCSALIHRGQGKGVSSGHSGGSAGESVGLRDRCSLQAEPRSPGVDQVSNGNPQNESSELRDHSGLDEETVKE